jgi:hypothetical protein
MKTFSFHPKTRGLKKSSSIRLDIRHQNRIVYILLERFWYLPDRVEGSTDSNRNIYPNACPTAKVVWFSSGLPN